MEETADRPRGVAPNVMLGYTSTNLRAAGGLGPSALLTRSLQGFTEAPQYILALHLYTCDSDLYRECNKALRHGVELETWRPFAYYTVKALDSLEQPMEKLVLYRGSSLEKADLSVYVPNEVCCGSRTILNSDNRQDASVV